jgi:hypothetical protein
MKPMNQTLQITLSDKAFASLERIAKDTHQPLEVIAALWLEQVATERDDPLDALIGSFSSAGSDWSDHHDAHLGKAAIGQLE